jgi:hypothetical protein
MAEPAERRGFFIPSLIAAGAVAAVMVTVMAVNFLPGTSRDAGTARAVSPVRDLSVVADGERVVLNWSDGGAPRKVFRATSHGELANIRALPARTVAGETWVDEEPAAAPIVYYVIE